MRVFRKFDAEARDVVRSEQMKISTNCGIVGTGVLMVGLEL